MRENSSKWCCSKLCEQWITITLSNSISSHWLLKLHVVRGEEIPFFVWGVCGGWGWLCGGCGVCVCVCFWVSCSIMVPVYLFVAILHTRNTNVYHQRMYFPIFVTFEITRNNKCRPTVKNINWCVLAFFHTSEFTIWISWGNSSIHVATTHRMTQRCGKLHTLFP